MHIYEKAAPQAPQAGKEKFGLFEHFWMQGEQSAT